MIDEFQEFSFGMMYLKVDQIYSLLASVGQIRSLANEYDSVLGFSLGFSACSLYKEITESGDSQNVGPTIYHPRLNSRRIPNS
jgi:hypothetical protein